MLGVVVAGDEFKNIIFLYAYSGATLVMLGEGLDLILMLGY